MWSTISTPLLFVAAGWLAVDPSGGLVASVILYAVVFLGIEAIARRRLLAFVVSVFGVALAVSAITSIAQGVYGQWQVVLAALLGIAAIAVLVANLRDLRRG